MCFTLINLGKCMKMFITHAPATKQEDISKECSAQLLTSKALPRSWACTRFNVITYQRPSWCPFLRIVLSIFYLGFLRLLCTFYFVFPFIDVSLWFPFAIIWFSSFFLFFVVAFFLLLFSHKIYLELMLTTLCVSYFLHSVFVLNWTISFMYP